MPTFTTYKEFLSHLNGLGQFHMDLGLDRITRVLDALGVRRPAPCVVQIVGTNGKGSTAAFLDSLAREHELTSGLTTSPHFLSPRERILISGHMLPEEEWTSLANEIMDAGGDQLTYFELITAIAALAFRRAGVDLAVLETGLGGQYDATTALDADLVLFTPIGLDHQKVLGSTLEAVALDKSRAIRPGGAAITGPQKQPALAALQSTATERNAVLLNSNSGSLPNSRLGLAGSHQKNNAALALAAYRRLNAHCNLSLDEAAISRGLLHAWLPGRLHILPADGDLHSGLILDIAHNPPAMAILRRTLAELDIRPASVIFTCLADKDLKSLAPDVLELTRGPILVPELPDMPRSQPAADVVEVLGPRARAVSGMAEALLSSESPALICGSLFLLAEFFRLQPQALHRPSQ